MINCVLHVRVAAIDGLASGRLPITLDALPAPGVEIMGTGPLWADKPGSDGDAFDKIVCQYVDDECCIWHLHLEEDNAGPDNWFTLKQAMAGFGDKWEWSIFRYLEEGEI